MSENESIRRIVSNFADRNDFSEQDFQTLLDIAEIKIKSILTRRGQKYDDLTLEDLVSESIMNFLEFIRKNPKNLPENPAAYFHTVCNNTIYRVFLLEPSPEYALFRRRFNKTIKKLENEGKIHSSKESTADSSAKLLLQGTAVSEELQRIAEDFSTTLLITEERWTSEKLHELEELVLYILKEITGSIKLNHLEKCVANRIYIQQNETMSLFETDSHEDAIYSAQSEQLTDNSELTSEEQISFEEARNTIKEEVRKIAASDNYFALMLKAWHARNFEGMTLQKTAEKFHYLSPSGISDLINHKRMKELSDFMSGQLLDITQDDASLRYMKDIIYEDLDRIIREFEEGIE